VWKELDPIEWFEEIDNGLEYRKLYGLEAHWAELEALFYNVHNSNVREGPNIVASTGDSLLSSLTVPSPKFRVSATSKTQVMAARILESVDNQLVKLLGLREEIEKCVLHAYLWGRGILKIGYDSEWGWTENEKTIQAIPGMSLSQFDKKGRRIEFSSRVKPGTPWVKACLPHDIVVPFGCTSFEDAPWVAHRVVRHIDDLKSDSKYTNVRDLFPVMTMEDYTKSYQSVPRRLKSGGEISSYSQVRQGTHGKAEFCELYEIHDRRTGKVLVIATGSEKFLRNDEDLLQLNGLPFVSIGFVPSARTFWVTPDAYYLKQAQAELSDISLQAQKQRRASILKFLYSEDAIDESEFEKLMSAEVGVGAKVRGGHSLNEVYAPVTPYNNNIQLQQDAEYVRRNARELVGFSRNQMGDFEARGRRTATEASIVQQAGSLRLSRRQLEVRRAYIETIKKINSLIFKYWTMPKWVQVLGENGAREWVGYQGVALKGDYTYDVGLSLEGEQTLEARRQQAIAIFQTFRGDPTIDQSALLSYLSSAFNDPELKGVLRNANLPVQMQGVPGGQRNLPTPSREIKAPQVS